MDSSEMYVGFYRNICCVGISNPCDSQQVKSSSSFAVVVAVMHSVLQNLPQNVRGVMVAMVSHIETTVKLSLILWAEIFIKHVHSKGYLFHTTLSFYIRIDHGCTLLPST
jgi:hypothetical protein